MFRLLSQARLTNPLAPKASPINTTQGVDQFSQFIQTIIGWLFVSGVLVFILFFLINAIKYIASQGDKQSVESARMGILQAVIGIVVLFGLWAVLRLIQQVFGVCMLDIPIPVIGQTVGGCSDSMAPGRFGQ